VKGGNPHVTCSSKRRHISAFQAINKYSTSQVVPRAKLKEIMKRKGQCSTNIDKTNNNRMCGQSLLNTSKGLSVMTKNLSSVNCNALKCYPQELKSRDFKNRIIMNHINEGQNMNTSTI
jgi:hypothetical protein